ncbi:hypothetical protein QBC34DRAFT_405041 [Podospora aff. communis PSN243]|uniref:Uncharacterized protein n=1 Tax=Podospora aff. communis PSN243 TaxID=3040156 RepID=A0AAV9GM93_9PEZI|nr:hypothetical protein QBC34DRAFT_405041 [Podospora aff. communis PSN243]
MTTLPTSSSTHQLQSQILGARNRDENWHEGLHTPTMSERTTEILVHITAPSRVADDKTYRQLAQAYFGFEPAARFPIAFSQGPSRELRRGDDRANSQTTGERATIDSPNLSFRSAFGNPESPRIVQPAQTVGDSQSSWAAPPSVIPDSLPDNNHTFAQFCSPTRILEHYISTFESSQSEQSSIPERRSQLSASQVQQRRSQLAWELSGHRRPFQQTISRQCTTGSRNLNFSSLAGEISDSEPTTQLEPEQGSSFSTREEPGLPSPCPRVTVIPQSPESRKPQRRDAVSNQPSFVEETRIASSFPTEIVSSPRADSEPPFKRARTSLPPFPGQLVRSSSDIPRHEPPKAKSTPQSLDHLEILAPEPPASLHDLQPSDLVTEALLDLAQRVDLRSRYRPQHQSRELRPFERGYWLVDCRSWEQDLKDSAWEFLTDYLQNGLVGWGVRCRRDQPFTWMRLYCWGGVVEYLYLVIWVASKRRVRFTGATWVGSDGSPTIVVGARPPSR